MKNIILLFLFLVPVFLFAQYPTQGNKSRLGYQTTGDGLIWRGVAADTSYKPIGLNYPYFQLDTVNGIFRRYIRTRGRWQEIGGGTDIDSLIYATRFWVNSNFFPLQGGTLTGTGGAGFIGFPSQVSAPGAPASGLNVYAQGSSFNWKGTDGHERQFASTLTGGRTYTLPDVSGTFALGTGTATRIPIWTSTNALGDSPILYNSTTKRTTWDSPGVIELPMGTDAQRPTATTSDFWYNTTGNGPEWYNGSRWAKALESTFNRGTATYVPYFDVNGQVTQNAFLAMLGATAALQIPVGTTAQRPTVTAGLIRVNSTTQSLEFGNVFGGTFIAVARANNATGDFNAEEIPYGDGTGARLNASSNFRYTSSTGTLNILSGKITINNSPSGSDIVTALDLARTAGATNPTVGSGIGIIFRRRAAGGSFGNDVISHKVYAYNTGTTNITTGYDFSTKNDVAGASAGVTAMELIGNALGIGTTGTIDASAILQLNSTAKGFLGVRHTNAQRTAVSSPATGLEVFQTDATEGKYVKYAAGWKRYLVEGDAAVTWLKPSLEAGRVNINQGRVNILDFQQDSSFFKLKNGVIYSRHPSEVAGDFASVIITSDTSGRWNKSQATVAIGSILGSNNSAGFGYTLLGSRTTGISNSFSGRFSTAVGYDMSIDSTIEVVALGTKIFASKTSGNTLVGSYIDVAKDVNNSAGFGRDLTINHDYSFLYGDGLATVRQNEYIYGSIYNPKHVFVGTKFIFASDSTFSFDASNDVLRLSQYGTGTKEAADLSKTQSNYIAGFATDGTVLDLERKRDTTIFVTADTDYDFSAAVTTAQISRRYNRIIIHMTLTSGVGADKTTTLHAPDANLMQCEILIRGTDNTGSYANNINFGTNNAISSDGTNISGYTLAQGQGMHVRVVYNGSAYKYIYY